jgi:hypothetical protein
LTLAAGVLGVASLAFVGVGGYAAFTSSVGLNAKITSGTFAMEATAGKAETACNPTNPSGTWCHPGDAVNATANNGTIAQQGFNASTINYTIPNMAPGDEYFGDVLIKDVGTLQGTVNTVAYTPPQGTPSALLQNMSVGVEEYACSVSSGSRIWVPLALVGTGSSSGTPQAADHAWTFSTNGGSYGGCGGYAAFLQPWLNSGAVKPGDEASAEFRVIFALNQGAGNSASGSTTSPTITFNGSSMP